MEHLKAFTARFIDLSVTELVALETIFTPVTIKKMDHLMISGDYVKDIYFIDSGLFRGYYMKEGEEYTTGFYYSPLMFAELFSIRKCTATEFNLQALQESNCYKASFYELEKLMVHYPNIKRLFFRLYEMLYMYGVKRQVSFIYDSPKERYDKICKEFPKIIDDIPLQYIASYLGIKPETLSRIRRKG